MCSYIFVNVRMFRSCGDILFNDLLMFLLVLFCIYIFFIDIKLLKIFCRKGFVCMGILSVMEFFSDVLNVLFFVFLFGYIIIFLLRLMFDIIKY